MELSEMPCKIRKRRFPTASSSSFANNNISQLLVEQTRSDSPANEKYCINMLDRSNCTEEVQKSEADNGVHEVLDRSRNKSRTSPARVSAPKVINSHYRSCRFVEKDKSFSRMHLNYDANLFEGKSRPCGEIKTETKTRRRSVLKPTHDLDEIKQSLTISKELLKLLTHIWTVDTNHDHHPMSISLTSTLNHELNKARSHVNRLIQEQRSNTTTSCEPKEKDKVRFAVKTIARELEIERKLRRQTERINKKLGRELANTKSSLSKAIEKAESEKRATEILEQLCEKMAHNIEEDRIELEELKKESEKVREEMEEEREMLRVADMLREERVHMKLSDAKYEYEDKHAQVNMIARDLEELLEVDNNTSHLKKTHGVLSWYQNRGNDKGEDENASLLWYENDKGELRNDENALGDKTRGLSWPENKGVVVNDENTLGEETTNTRNEVIERYNSDCIELEFGFDMKNESEDLNGCLEEEVLGVSYSYEMKEYEDEMERYKMIKDLRDRIVSGSDRSRDTLEFGSYT